MSIIYQSKYLEMLTEEEIKNCIKNTDITSESIDRIRKYLKDIYSNTEKGKEIIEEIKNLGINIERNKIIEVIEKNFQKIREHLFPLLQNDNLNILMSNGCSIYSGSVGINGETKEDLNAILNNFCSEEEILSESIKEFINLKLTPEAILDKLYQIKNYHELIIKKDDDNIEERLKELIKNYQKKLLESYVLGIDYSKTFLHEEFLRKILGIKKESNTTIFTLNYDILIEKAAEKLNLSLNNGFQGFHIRKFNPINFSYKNYMETIDGSRKIKKSINLIKLHGSLSWKYDVGFPPYNIVERQLKINDNNKIEYNNVFSETISDEVIIYPTQTKKKYSLDLPYSELFRQFNESLNKSNNTFLVMGYSFLDEHINDLIESSLANPSINIILFLYMGKEVAQTNPYLKKLIEGAEEHHDNRITILFGNMLSDFEYIVKKFLPIENEKDPIIEIEKLLHAYKKVKNGKD